jgi:hypothetical protein
MNGSSGSAPLRLGPPTSGFKHDQLERGEGRLAEHQIDVTARHPGGVVKRLIIECKDWQATVEKDTLDTLVGVRDQLEADAAVVVTTLGFSEGAGQVAVDEGIAMVILRPFTAADQDRFVKKIVLEGNYFLPSFSDFDFDFADDAAFVKDKTYTFDFDGSARLHHLDGTPAETIGEILQANTAGMTAGESEFEVDLPGGRLLPTLEGDQLPITAMRWKETVHHAQTTNVIEKDGEPCLVMEQLDSDGQVEHGRMVVDQDLYGWEIDHDGRVIPKGELGPNQ